VDSENDWKGLLFCSSEKGGDYERVGRRREPTYYEGEDFFPWRRASKREVEV